MAELKCLEGIQEKLLEKFTAFRIHSAADGCYVETPFKDASGDSLMVRIQKNGATYTVDDGGYISQLTDYVQPGTAAIRRMNNSLRSYPKLFGAILNKDEGAIEIRCQEEQLADIVLRILQLIISLDANLSLISTESQEQETRSRTSLGPRVATKIAKSMKRALNQNLVLRDVTIDGQAVDDWRVDLFYEPKFYARRPVISSVVVIAVDLNIKEPIQRAGDALARAWDIKSAHEDFEIRVALDTHGQNGHVVAAKKLLEEHQGDKFFVYDLTTESLLTDFTNQISAELGVFVA